jgi:hypothetical protein
MRASERRTILTAGVTLAAVGLSLAGAPCVSLAQHAPPIVTSFDGETLEDTADLPRPLRGSRPLPPIVSEFDGDEVILLDEDEPLDDAALHGDEALGDEDPEEERRHLQHALLVERRRAMARAAQISFARRLASPFRAPSPEVAAPVSPPDELPRAIDRLELGVASVNAPLTSVGLHDDGMRIRVGAGLDAYREAVGFRVRLEPLVVLQSAGTLSLPHEYVRTAFTGSITYRTPVSASLALFVGGGFEHVGDYTTLGPSGSLLTNQLFARGGLLFDGGLLHGLVRLSAGLHVFSDTTLADDVGGTQSVEMAVDVVLRSGSPAAAVDNVQLCGGVHASYLAPNTPRILEEAHLDLTAGVCVREATLGDLSLVLELGLGNEPHWNRAPQSAHIGAALRWSL